MYFVWNIHMLFNVINEDYNDFAFKHKIIRVLPLHWKEMVQWWSNLESIWFCLLIKDSVVGSVYGISSFLPKALFIFKGVTFSFFFFFPVIFKRHTFEF